MAAVEAEGREGVYRLETVAVVGVSETGRRLVLTQQVLRGMTPATTLSLTTQGLGLGIVSVSILFF